VLSAVCVAPFVSASAVSAGTDVTAVTGTAGNAQVSLSWTAPTDTTFPFTFNGSSYNSVYVSSNTYITFGSGSSQYSGLAPNSPGIPGVHICSRDNSYQRVQYLINTAVTPNELRVRYEGTASTGGTNGSPNIVYEAVFYKNQSYFDLLIGPNAACASGGVKFVTNGSSAIASPAFAANTRWRINGSSVTQNGGTSTWVGSSSGSTAANGSGFTSVFNSNADDTFLQVPVAPTGYAIRYSSNGGTSWTTFTNNTGSTATSGTVTGLVNGTGYIFQVAAYYSSTNQTGPWSTSSATLTPLGTPSAPATVSRTMSDGQAALSWTVPSSNGGSAITDYRVEYSSNSGSSYSVFTDGVSTSTSATVTGLTNGTSYLFRVAAINANGTGSYTVSSAGTPFGLPAAPTGVTPTAGSSQASLTWTAPSNNGSSITSYAVEYSSDGGTNWTTATTNTGSATASYTVTGLTGGVNYVFRVAATNAAGRGSFSSTSGQVTVFGVPATPNGPTPTAGNAQVTLNWSAPSANGSAISGYAIQFSSNNGASWTTWSPNTGSAATSAIVNSSLSNGTSYVFRVAARNASGLGSYSSNSAAVTPFTTPGTPTSVTASAGNLQATVSWTAPSNNGSAITDYTIQFSSNSGLSWTTFADGVSSSTSATVTGLTNGVAYVFRAAATNVAGTSTFSSASAAVTPRSVPGPPTGVAGTAGNTQVRLAWSSPTSNGGSAITGYAVQYSADGGSNWITLTSNTASTSKSYTVTGLTNGIAYNFRVAARNVVGLGAYSADSAAITPFTTPGAPTSVTGSAGNAQVTVAWTAPTSTGGDPVSDYIIEYSANSGSTWITFADGTSSATSATVTGLTNGTGYIFRVTARNTAGSGSASLTSSSVVPRTVPSAVPSVSGTAGSTQVVLSWGLPVSTGGSAITDYVVEYSDDAGVTWSTFADGVSTTRATTVSGLTNGSEYVFRVAAVNAAGSGTRSQVSAAVTPYTTPGQPTAVSGTSGDAQVTVAWTAPSGNGGSAITNYNVQYSSNSGGSWTTFTRSTSTALSAVVTGLTNGTGYVFRVAAVNAAGAGSYSAASSSVTPMRIASAPTMSTVTPANEQVTITWSAPTSNGGSTITDYSVQYSSSGGSSWSTAVLTGSTSTSFAVTGLRNGSTYVFRVAAVNSVGVGTYSSVSSATTPRTVPDAPTDVVSTTGNTQVSLVWTAPVENGGMSITDYVVQYSSNNGTSWTTFNDGTSSQRAATVTGLTNGTEYVFRVAAVNVAGTGAYSSQSAGSTPRTVPTAPMITSIDTGNAQLTVNFTAGDSGGTVITTYDYSTDGGVTWRARALGTTASPIVITTQSVDGTSSLSNGVTYSVRIRAVNAAGPGSASSTSTATPLTLPTVPLSVSATPGSTSANVSWSAPTSNGGATITDYVVQFSANSGTSWSTFADGVSSATTASVTSLTNGTPYIFRVAAVNSVGSSSYSLASTSVTPRSAPSAPSGLSVTPGNGTLAASWTAPASGGAVITDYTIQYSSNSGSSWTTFSDGLSVSTSETIAGLTNGTGYLVRVAAVNAAGTGTWTTASSNTTPRTVPSPPVLGVVSRLDSSLSIAFTAGSDGGSAITSYQSSIDGGISWQSVSGLSSPLVLNDLTNGTTYTVTMRAVNAAGTGSASVSVQGTPRTAPSAPTISAITPGNSSLSVAYTVANTGGSTVQNVEYSVTGGVTWASAGSTTSPLVISGLTNGTSYQVRLRAINAAGTSPQSSMVSSSPYTTPGAPTITSVAGGVGSVTIAFTAGYNGGSAITNYAYSTDNGVTWTTRSPVSTTSPVTVSGLSDGVRYNVRIRALNAAGNGAASDAASVLTKGVPGAPTIASVSQMDGQVAATIVSGTNGGDPITNFAYSLDGGTNWTTRSPASTNPTLVISGLTNGTNYNLRVRAINSVGSGDASAIVVARPRTTPAAPTINSQTSGNQQLTIAFTAGSDGGEPITSYEYSTDRGTTWSVRGDGGEASTTLTISALSTDGTTALTNGVTYDVQVRAVNVVGSGDESDDIAGTPKTTPSAPLVTSVQELNQQFMAYFLPTSNGGARITSYQYTTDGGTTWIAASSLTSPIRILTVSSDGTTLLTNGTSYDVALRAVNSVGPGAASSNTASVPHTSPGAPSVTGVTPSNGSISVAFTEGANGGATITSYDYSTDGGATWRTRAPGFTMVSSPITITTLSSDGLTSLSNGSSYDVLIRAVNSAGAGDESITTSVIPSGAPSSPVITSVVGDDGSLVVNYTAGSANGRAITLTEYSTNGGVSWTSSTSLTSPLTITSLTNGTEYLVSLRHTNINGTSDGSVAVVGKPRSRPLAPTITDGTSSDGSVTVTFTAPASDGGDTITSYDYSTDNGATWRTRAFGTTETFIGIPTLSTDGTTALANGTVYNVRVRAVNGAGGGVTSDAIAIKPYTRPSAAVISAITPGDSIADVSYTLASTGGSVITDIEFTLDGGNTWTSANSVANPVRVPGLVNGTAQSIAIRMVNLAGVGPASNSMNATPTGTPGAPTITTLTAGDGQLIIDFVAGDDSGAAISNYQYSTDDGTTWVTPSTPVTTSPIVVSGLVNGRVYATRIRAVNANGSGAMSDAVLSKPFTVPAAPAAQARPSTNEIRITFTPPTNDGGESIIGYEYSLDNGVTWVTVPPGTNGEFVITNLVNATTYTVTFRAISAAGSGDMVTAQTITEQVQTPAPSPAPTPTPAAAPVSRVETPIVSRVTPVTAPQELVVATPTVNVLPTKSVTKKKTSAETEAKKPAMNKVSKVVLDVPELPMSEVFASNKGKQVAAVIEKISESTVQVSVGNSSVKLAAVTPSSKKMKLNSAGHLVLAKDGYVNAVLEGFAPDAEVMVYIYSEPRLLGTFPTDANGNAIITTRLPADLEPGSHTVEVRGAVDDGSVMSMGVGVEVVAEAESLEVVEDVPAEVPTETPVPAVTERDGEKSRALPLTLAGFMLLIAAGGWLAVARRRRREV
jgi:hypothetical protein